MNTFSRKLLAITILLIPFGWLHAQENKHAQVMRTAIVETHYGKFSKDITEKWIPAKEDSSSVFWTALDGGGLVPKEKIHVVKLSESSANVGPLYLDGWRFEFNKVPDDPTLPIRGILDAFDKQAPYASSYYSYVAGDEQAAFPGICITYGVEGKSIPLALYPQQNVRVIGFKDDDGFRSTYLLSWFSAESDTYDEKHKLYDIEGVVYEFHCPKMKNLPQVKAYNPDEYLERTNLGLSVAHNLVHNLQSNDPELASMLSTDTLMEKYSYSFQTMLVNLYKDSSTPNVNTSYEALNAKLQRMVELTQTANQTELHAICYTLDKEIDEYPFMLSGCQAKELNRMTDAIDAAVSQDMKVYLRNARTSINRKLNPTIDIDSLSEQDREFLNHNGWKLIHQPVDYAQTVFTGKGEHYSGDLQKGYFEVKGKAVDGFYAETCLQPLLPGRYRVSAVVRGAGIEHSGVCVFAKTGKGVNEKMVQKEVPAWGNQGGNIWFSALCRFEKRAAEHIGVYALDINKATANGGQGFGWNRIYLDDITVSGTTLTYGISTRPKAIVPNDNDSKWFSACDFIVERVGD